MAKKEYEIARQRTLEHLKEAQVENYMLHGPTSDDYWSSSVRILAVNMESYGYEDCGHWDVDLKCLLGWMFDEGNTDTRTVRYTIAFAKTLLDAYASGTPVSPEGFRAAYQDEAGLESVVRSIVYTNIRPGANPNKEQDVANIIAGGSASTAPFVREEMLALQPHVIVVSGHAGLNAFNQIWQLDPPLPYGQRTRCSAGVIIQSIRHPSRPNYAEFTSIVTDLVEALNAGNQ